MYIALYVRILIRRKSSATQHLVKIKIYFYGFNLAVSSLEPFLRGH